MMPAVPARVDLATPAEPDQGVPGITRARLKAAALGVVGALLVPLPAAAAPTPCDQALRYAALSGAQLMRIANLDPGPNAQPTRDLGLGETRSALVAQSQLNAAALGRLLDGGPTDRQALTTVVRQTAPPSHRTPEQRGYQATDAGPFRLGKSKLTMHARWDPGMACGNTAGEATRAGAELRRAEVLENGDSSLVRVPGKISSRSTTAMERRGPAARAVAEASLTAGKIELLDGAIKVKIVKPPSLLATMSGTDGGEVRYKPAVIEVSGRGFERARLDTAGDKVELHLDENGNPEAEGDSAAGQGGGLLPRETAGGGAGGGSTSPQAGGGGAGHSGVGPARAGLATGGQGGGRVGQVGVGQVGVGQVGVGQVGVGQVGVSPAGGGQPYAGEGVGGKVGAGAQSASNDNVRKPGAPDDYQDKMDVPGDSEDELFAGLPDIGALDSAEPIPLPDIPALPPIVTPPGTEAGPAAGPGTTVKISLGDVRQAVFGHAIAAKATAMTIAISRGPNSSTETRGVLMDLNLGLLEVAAVAPEPEGVASGEVSGRGGGLPITGPRVDVVALAGLALLIAGAGALVFGLRGSSRR